jgi:hypothetical protein
MESTNEDAQDVYNEKPWFYCNLIKYDPIIDKYQSHNAPSLIEKSIHFYVRTVGAPQLWPVR